MKLISLSELMQKNPYDAALAGCLKKRDIEGMATRLSAGACPTSASNVLHYNPELILEILEASNRLEPDMRHSVQTILGAMCHRLSGQQRELYRVWMTRNAAASALEDIAA
jgi:hypothetical protein